MKLLITILHFLAQKFQLLLMSETLPLNDRLYEVAFSFLGREATPNDEVEDALACVHTLSTIISLSFSELRFPILFSTKDLYRHLKNSPSWKQVDLPQHGDVILCVTGTGNDSVSNGHCGVVGKRQAEDMSVWIMSNDSRNGLWSANYSLTSWQRYFGSKGGYISHFFRRV